MSGKLSVMVVALLMTLASSAPLYNFAKSYVTQLTPINFADQITKIRQNTNYVAVVHYFKEGDSGSAQLAKQLDTWTNQFTGVFRVGAVDCALHAKLCADQSATTFPTVKIYPPVPVPIESLTTDLTVTYIQKVAARFLHTNSIEITAPNLQTFLNENPSVPKVLLFTDKKGSPMIYKGLSVAFQKKLNFGIVRNTESQLVSQYSVKSFPTLLVVKTGDKKPHVYKEKEFKFRALFDFLNVYSQTFVPGGGSSLDSSATKEWMTQSFPQLHLKSSQDLCLGVEGALCVILISNQKPQKAVNSIFQDLKGKYERKIDRGAKFSFMWLNATAEKKWASTFGFEQNHKVVILNPGKRKRFTVHEGPVTVEALSNTLDAISGGDARFNKLNDLPILEMRV